MIIEEKNLTQDEFLRFYNTYVRRMSKVNLAAWIIRLIPENEVKKMMDSA